MAAIAYKAHSQSRLEFSFMGLGPVDYAREGVTYIELHPSEEYAGGVRLDFHNYYVNDSGDNGLHSLSLNGINVTIRYIWDATETGADAVEIFPPDGYGAEPEMLIVEEMDHGSAEIYPALF